MAATILTSVQEYLATSFRPDREYADGAVLERHVGERDHSRAQMRLSAYLFNRAAEWGIHVFPEQRVQVKPTRFRVPDIAVVAGDEPDEQVLTTPPFLCVEVLSKDDTVSSMPERIDDYLDFGVSQVWVLDPRLRRVFVQTREGMRTVHVGEVRTEQPDIAVPLDSIFR